MPRIPRDRKIRWPRLPLFVQDLLFVIVAVFSMYAIVEMFYDGIDLLIAFFGGSA